MPSDATLPGSQMPAVSAHPLRDRVQAHRALKIFTVINWITIIVAVLAAIAELLSLINMSKKTVPSITVRLYCLFFLVIIILSELEWSKPVRDSAITTSWFWRGVFQIFVAALVYEMKPQGSSVTEAEQNFIIFTSLVLLVIGFLYAGMGLCFVKRWRDSNLAKYRTMRAHAEMADELQGDPSLAPPPRV
ncbi:golgi apparatus membrane protein tvp15 [Nannochloropsis oceanica]